MKDVKSDSQGFNIQGDTCEEVMVGAAALAKGFGATKPEIGRITVNGDEARVVYENNGGKSISIFVREGDRWLFDSEEDAGEAGGSGESTNSDELTAAEVKQWPEKWCQVRPGMTKDEVVEIMGEPTDEYEGTNPQVSYDAYEYGFTAFFGVDGTVRQLDINTIDLSEEQIAAIPCEETRKR